MGDWTMEAMRQIHADAVKRLTRACIECVKDLKLIVSAAAPRKVAKTSGRVYAATRATKGAPPRKLTGRGRASIGYQVDRVNLIGRVGTNVIYMPVHEYGVGLSGGLHKWVEPTMWTHRTKYEKILGS